jgi:hypothetical protein
MYSYIRQKLSFLFIGNKNTGFRGAEKTGENHRKIIF